MKLTWKCKCPDIRKLLQVQMSTHDAEYNLLWLYWELGTKTLCVKGYRTRTPYLDSVTVRVTAGYSHNQINTLSTRESCTINGPDFTRKGKEHLAGQSNVPAEHTQNPLGLAVIWTNDSGLAWSTPPKTLVNIFFLQWVGPPTKQWYFWSKSQKILTQMTDANIIISHMYFVILMQAKPIKYSYQVQNITFQAPFVQPNFKLWLWHPPSPKQATQQKNFTSMGKKIVAVPFTTHAIFSLPLQMIAFEALIWSEAFYFRNVLVTENCYHVN